MTQNAGFARRSIGLTGMMLLATLVAAFVPPAGAQSQGLFTLDDAPGDVEVRPASIVGVAAPASGPDADAVDIRTFAVASESPQSIVMEIHVTSLAAFEQMSVGESFYFEVSFQITGSPITYYAAAYFDQRASANSNGLAEPQSVSLCISTSGGSCYRQSASAYLDVPQNKLVFEIPKLSLLGLQTIGRSTREPMPQGVPTALPAGTVIQGWWVRAEHTAFGNFGFGGYFNYRDLAPNQAPSSNPFLLTQPAANTIIKLSAATTVEVSEPFGDGNQAATPMTVAIRPGTGTSVPVVIKNTGESKRLLNLSATFPGAEAQGKFTAKLVKAIEVPGGDERIVSVLVNATTAVQHRELATLEVRAAAIGHSDEIGFLAMRIQGSAPPSPTQNTLYFHAKDLSDDDVHICIFFCPNMRSMWLNTLAEDETADLDATGITDVRGFSFPFISDNNLFRTSFILDTPTAEDLFFDPMQPTRATLSFSSRVPFTGVARIDLFAGPVGSVCNGQSSCNDVLIGTGSADFTAESAPKSVEISFAIDPGQKRIQAPSTLRAQVRLMSENYPQSTANGLEGVTFYPKDSHIVLPLVKGQVESKSSGTSLLGVYTKDKEIFLNPGKGRAVSLLVVNEATEGDKVALNASASLEGWKVTIHPASKYNLEAGKSANITVLISAPEGAKENDAAQISIQAKSVNDETRATTVFLTARTTRTVEIADESNSFKVDAEAAAQAAVDEGGKSPGLGALGLAAALAAAMLLVRRRR
jgi:hypothetical protein